MRLFLSMRQEQINQLRDQKELLKKQCGGLPKEEGDRCDRSCPEKSRREWRERPCPSRWNGTRALLERTLQADKALSRRLAGRESFYQS